MSGSGPSEPPEPPEPTAHRPGRVRRAVRWFVVDRSTGHVVIGQRPNAAILLLVAATLLRLLLVTGLGWEAAEVPLRVAAAAALAWWGLDELLRGVNPLRRVLGAAALGYLLLVRLPMLLG